MRIDDLKEVRIIQQASRCNDGAPLFELVVVEKGKSQISLGYFKYLG
jgi:hypothetical protein